MVRPQGFLRLATRSTPPRKVVQPARRTLTVLGIETSADDTCVALLTLHRGNNALQYHERVSCDNTRHRGIHPSEAAASHTRHLPRLIHNAMQHLPTLPRCNARITATPSEVLDSQRQGLSFDKIPQRARARPPRIRPKPDLIAVTRGPGMGGCLTVGVSTAMALSVAWQVPVIGVHHMQAHALTPLMELDLQNGSGIATSGEHVAEFPFLTLLVSGKHTMLVYTKSITSHRILASIQYPNIALGDLLDKCARDIVPESHIPQDAKAVVYPKLMEELVGESRIRNYQAAQDRASEINVYHSKHGWEISPPLRHTRELVYDYSGLNGYVQKVLRERPSIPDEERQDLAFHIMRTAFEHLMSRVIFALQADQELLAEPPTRLMLSGGVASNLFLRHVAQSTLRARGYPDITVVAPDPKWCTDNAAMIAYAGARMYNAGWLSNIGFSTQSKWSIEEIISGVDCWVKRQGYWPHMPPSDATKSRSRSSAKTEMPQVGSKPGEKDKVDKGTHKEPGRAEGKEDGRTHTEETGEKLRVSPSAKLTGVFPVLQLDRGTLRREGRRWRNSRVESDERVRRWPVSRRGQRGQLARNANAMAGRVLIYQRHLPLRPLEFEQMKKPPSRRPNLGSSPSGAQGREETRSSSTAPARSPSDRDRIALQLMAHLQPKITSTSGRRAREYNASMETGPDPISEIPTSGAADLYSLSGAKKRPGRDAAAAAAAAADNNSSSSSSSNNNKSRPRKKRPSAVDKYYKSLRREEKRAEERRKIWASPEGWQEMGNRTHRKVPFLEVPPPEPTSRKQAESGSIMDKVAQIGDMIWAKLGLGKK